MGDINASIPTPQPSRYRPMFGALGKSAPNLSYTFVTQRALEIGLWETLKTKGFDRNLRAAKSVNGLSKKNMVFNDACPVIEVDAQTYNVKADGEPLVCQPATELPMTQRYFLF
jgi:urease subunit alpha